MLLLKYVELTVLFICGIISNFIWWFTFGLIVVKSFDCNDYNEAVSLRVSELSWALNKGLVTD